MYNLLIGVILGILVFGGITAWLGPLPAILPAVGVLFLALFLLARRTGRLVTAEMEGVAPLLQARRIDEAQTKLVGIKEKYGPWQFLVAGQIDAQLGVIDYLQMKFEEAAPKLERGRFRNPMALLCLGCIDWRRGRKVEAIARFQSAASASSQDVTVYAVWATLLARDHQATQALEVLARGLKAVPGNKVLTELQGRVANRKKIEVDRLGESWYQYFPEEYAQKMAMRGSRFPSPPMANQPQPRFGARHAPRR
jgi:hypothetical protein